MMRFIREWTFVAVYLGIVGTIALGIMFLILTDQDCMQSERVWIPPHTTGGARPSFGGKAGTLDPGGGINVGGSIAVDPTQHHPGRWVNQCVSYGPIRWVWE